VDGRPAPVARLAAFMPVAGRQRLQVDHHSDRSTGSGRGNEVERLHDR
jgi:hypothetical protein